MQGRADSRSLPSTPRLPANSLADPKSTHERLHSSHTSRATGPTACPEQKSECASEKEDTFLEGQTLVASAPGAAAAEVRRAFAKITSSSGSSSAGDVTFRSGSKGAEIGTPGHVQQPGSPASPDLLPLEPGVAGKRAHTAAADSVISLTKAESQTASGAAQQNEKPASQVSSDQDHDHFLDQHGSAAAAILPIVQTLGELGSSVREQPTPEQPALGRAMSLKGAAAADTARAFSHLRGRAGTFPVTAHPPGLPVSHPTSLDGTSSTKAVLPGVAEADTGPTDTVSEPGSSFVMDLWGQQSESSTVRLEDYHSAEKPILDLFPERSAGQMGRPVNTAGGSLSDASSHAAAAVPSSLQRQLESSKDPEPLDSPGIAVPQSAFYQHTTERADVSTEALEVQQTPRQPSSNEVKSQVRLPHSRAESKLVSPRKRASLGRRLSGLLPGVKGKERMRAAPATKEVRLLQGILQPPLASEMDANCRGRAPAASLAAQLCGDSTEFMEEAGIRLSVGMHGQGWRI